MKKTSHCTVRENTFLCLNCGGVEILRFPMRPDVFAARGKVFELEHKFCKPGWKPPEADQTQTIEQRARWWNDNGERGISSKTIFTVIFGDTEHGFGLLPKSSYCHPQDPDDFRRCYLLLKAIPEWRAELPKLKAVSKTWANLVDNWDKLTDMLEEQMRTEKPNGMYEFMQSLGC